MTQVINLYGGPGTGKSATAAGLFFFMKVAGYKVELVTEYAKDMVWSDRTNMFEYQEYIFAKQRHRIERLMSKVDYIITDSPINLGHFYMPPGRVYAEFGDFMDACYDTYDNLNILLQRPSDRPYEQYGRVQTEEEANEIHKKMDEFFKLRNIKYDVILATIDAPQRIIDVIERNNA